MIVISHLICQCIIYYLVLHTISHAILNSTAQLMRLAISRNASSCAAKITWFWHFTIRKSYGWSVCSRIVSWMLDILVVVSHFKDCITFYGLVISNDCCEISEMYMPHSTLSDSCIMLIDNDINCIVYCYTNPTQTRDITNLKLCGGTRISQ